MERANKRRNKKGNKARKPPRVPIKTYRWEDIRRARRRGGYPWTHLYKRPFNEIVDPDQFTMDALRRSKSASTMGARSDGVEISEVSSFAESGKTTPSCLLPTEFVTEPPEDISAKHSRAGSEVIEEYDEGDEKDLVDDVQIKEFRRGSAASSDNISQYLDREERGPSNSNTNGLEDDKNENSSASRDERAKSEEIPQRKRKLSAESSYSRYSLSRLGVMKKLRDASSKIKIPKISFPTKKINRKKTSPPKEIKKEDKKSKKESKNHSKKALDSSRLRKNDKPVYIYIPLKPPPGETDEFSYLEHEPKKSNDDKSGEMNVEPKKDQELNQTDIKDNKMDIDETKSENLEKDDPGENVQSQEDEKEDNKENSPFSTLERGPRVTKKPPLKINPAFKQFLKDVRQLKDKDDTGIQKEEEDVAEKDKETGETTTKKPEQLNLDLNTSPKDKVSETPKSDDEEILDLEEQQTSDSESPKEDVFDKLFEASASKKETISPTSSIKETTTAPRNVRSKSAEPEGKRRSSIDSSYSRKSLSKLGIMKKLKEASEKIKGAFSLTSLKRKDSKKEESKDKLKKESEKEKTAKKTKLTAEKKLSKLGKPKPVEPVYIHIPLKPPPGETDEFSHLAHESLASGTLEVTKEERTDSLDSMSPVSTKSNDIQFIFLTPPSDDEILDEKDPDIPETPSSSDETMFFGTLKKLAERAVDEVSPETKRKALETVREESVSDKGSTADVESLGKKVDEKATSPLILEEIKAPAETNIIEPETEKIPASQKPEDDALSKDEAGKVVEEEKMIVDVEDGLNEPPKTEELKSVLKTPDSSSPVMKKKVSFKRKIKPKVETEEDNGYEPIKAPKEKPVNLLEQAGIITETLGVDQEKRDEEIIKGQDNTLQESTPTEIEGQKKGFLLGNVSQSMSVEDEKSYLDQKIVKDTSLEEDYNKWSKSGDHEYEPINPPDEVILMTSSELPGVTVIESDNEAKIVISATEILDKPVEEKKKPFFQFGRFHKDKVQGDVDKNHGGSSDNQSRSSQGRDVPETNEQPKASEGPNKFQAALKQGTDQLKQKTNEFRNKIRNIKKPNIHMPKAPEFKKPEFKKPNFKKPEFKKPDFAKFKLEKGKINLHLPKIPDTASIHLPHISLSVLKKTTVTRTVEKRQYSTESNAGDSGSPKPRSKFDFDFSRTFPRFKKKKAIDEQNVAFATVPRAKKNKDGDKRTTESSSSSIRIPLHSEDSMDADEQLNNESEIAPIQTGYEDRESSEDIDRSPHMRFDQDIAIEDEYERENQEINRAEYLNRWQHGKMRDQERERNDRENIASEDERIIEQLVAERFKKVGQGSDGGKQPEARYERYEDNQSETLEDRLRRDEDRPRYSEDEEDFDRRFLQNKDLITDLDNLEEDENGGQIRDEYSSEGSGSLHRKGRLGKLDVDSDEFFVVHEIHEGFQTPANALAQMNEYDPIGSNRSLPQTSKRKPIKKPKRKKTPHVSQEELPGDEESIDDIRTPSRPRRKSKKNKKKQDDDDIVPYQKTIHLEHEDPTHRPRLDFPRESLGILGDDEDDQEFEMYENEKMEGKDQPEILVTDPYKEFQFKVMEEKGRTQEDKSTEPRAPPRRHRSLKSLTQSENESVFTDKYDEDRNSVLANIEDYIIPADQVQAPPKRPTRKSRSHTSSLSRVSLPPSQRDTDSILTDEAFLTDNQPIPSYLIENQHYKQQYKDNQEVPSYMQEDEPLKPCVEEPCIEDLRDYMGYSIVDKSRQRDPPLPPPRTPPRRRKRQIEPDQKFATVPRNVGSSQAGSSQPIRPLRNYSTLAQVKSNRKDSSIYENDKENRETEIDIAQYIEIDEDINRDLVSGEVVQKMRQRPLPAPPRPPRKTKTTRRSLQDITLRDNIIPTTSSPQDFKPAHIEEENVSTQTEPLPPDFVCEEIRQEPTDTIITPRISERVGSLPSPKRDVSEPQAEKTEQTEPQIRRELITPSVYSYEETVTHGSLLVEPLNGAKILPDHQLSKDRLIPITKDYSDDETSEIPESFKRLKSPDEAKETQPTQMKPQKPSVEILKTEKLQVSDLDVDRLRVNKLLASKIIVSEIDSSTISTDEIQSKSGSLRVGDIELPPKFLEEIVRKIEGIRPGETPSGEDRLQKAATDEEKKTSIIDFSSPSLQTSEENRTTVDPPLEPLISPLNPTVDNHLENFQSVEHSEHQQEFNESEQHEISPEPPVPPPRSYILENTPPDAPPRTLRRKSKDSLRNPDQRNDQSDLNFCPEKTDRPSPPRNYSRTEMLEPEIDDQPPPRPPQPLEGLYLPSQPPASFYALRAKQYVGLDNENIPTVPRRKRHQSSRSRPVSRSRSTSDDSSLTPSHPQTRSPRSTRRFSEPSIPELSGRLIHACGARINNSLKRLIYHLTENIVRNADGKQDLHVFMIILLVLIAGLILLGYGEDRTVVHLHHWEYFNPPKDL